jgi:cytoskeletal protein RodZ
MQNLTNFPNLIDRWLRYRFQTILVVCFLLWTPFLVAKTLQVQHSCYPMIHWSDTLPDECQAKVSEPKSHPSEKAKTQQVRSEEQKQIAQRDHSPSLKPSPTSQEQNQIAQCDRSPFSKPSSTPQPQISNESPTPQQTEKPNPIEEAIKTAKEHPDIAGGVIAIGVASTVAVVASAPLVLAAGIGAAVWFAIRTVL